MVGACSASVRSPPIRSCRPTAVTLPAVVKVLRGGDVTLSRTAAGTLGKIGKDAVDPLAKVLLDDENPQVRRLAAVALALLGSQAGSAGPALAKALGDDSFRVRRVVA